MKPNLDVLVVGAGPTGLAAATELRRQGLHCRIIDQASDRPMNQARAVTLWDGAMDVLRRQGTADRVRAEGLPLEVIRYWSGKSSIASFHLSGNPAAKASPIVITQPAVESAMADRLGGLGVDIEWKTRLASLEDHGDGVGVTMETPSGIERLEARWVVGCDGMHSSVREMAGIAFEGAPYPQSFILGDGLIDAPIPPGEAHYHLHPAGVLVTLPLPNGNVRVFADATAMSASDAPFSVEELQDLVNERAPYRLEIHELLWSTRFRIHMQQAASYRSGRCVIAGDAAHVHSPAGGQGLNTGIQDAANLAWKIGLAVGGHGHPDELLSSYEAERKPVAARVMQASHQQTKLWTVQSGLGRSIRNLLLGGMSRTGLMERKIVPSMAQFDLDYRHSPTVGNRGGRRAIGHGFVDAKVTSKAGSIVWLSDLLKGPRHTLLVFTGPAGIDSEVLGLLNRAAEAEAVDICVFSASDQARSPAVEADGLPDLDRYSYVLPKDFVLSGGLKDCKLVLVRPDGYVADAADSYDVDEVLTLAGLLSI
ncbi:FAD-dependent monooxygenase [Nocardia gamkensis]|uniref:FAD-binding protein n=1 Tax=Nocardia gamkensis TaxID=352869 RepID=A0A7X6KZN2_9NOCA|nr:FAD-dependent monooxygenase [Nocardia gamkensis]NKY25096.1 FAD-binding protein [Nocardia gamkensis]